MGLSHGFTKIWKKMTKETRNDLAKLSEKCPSTLKKTTQLGGIFDPKN
jgi:hypothetical protein